MKCVFSKRSWRVLSALSIGVNLLVTLRHSQQYETLRLDTVG
nr:MAG TPA: hypothetical protein [Caudoviricetes sp.]